MSSYEEKPILFTDLKKPSVVVVGAGAMGSVFGGLLSEGGLDVTLVDVWPEHVRAIQKNGLRMVGQGGDRTIKVKITDDARSLEHGDIVFFQCKATGNKVAAESVSHLFKNPNAIAVSFQNGLGNETEIGAIVGTDRILAGLTAQAAVLEAPGVVRNHAELPSYVGEVTGGASDRAAELARVLSSHGLTTHASPQIMHDKWRKLLVNIAFAATSGLTGLSLGGVLSVPALRETAIRAMEEAAAVAAAIGIELDPKERYETFDKIMNSGAKDNTSSMLADLKARRRSEVDYIYGTAIGLAEERAIAVPTLETLASLVRAIESSY
jgi:2-dehydropantoate 2-reductase